MTTAFPPVIQALHERLHFRIWGPARLGRFDTFRIDLASWQLSFTDRTPCFWIHTEELLSLPTVDLADEIRDAVREHELQNETVLVAISGPADDLRRQLSSSLTRFICLDEQQQQDIAAAHSPTRVALDICMKQVQRLILAPYETSSPVTGSRFFGRKEQLNKILAHPKNSYLVLGMRRIGKTSLLREVQRQLDVNDPPQVKQIRRCFIDCSVIGSAEEFYREVALRLYPRGLKELLRSSSQSLRYQAQIFEQLADLHGGQITFLLDEIDYLLDHLNKDYSMFDVLRRASLQGVARFLMAGYRQARIATNNDKSPFYNFAERLDLGPLDRHDVGHMIEYPLDQLRVSITSRDELTKRIFDETGGHPNLVQFYCRTLLEDLDRSGGNTISLDNLQAVYQNSVFRDIVLQNFMSNAAPLEKAIVFAIVAGRTQELAFTLKEIDAQITRRGPKIKLSALENACRNLELAGILTSHGKVYQFTVPLFARMLNENLPLEFALEKALAEIEANP